MRGSGTGNGEDWSRVEDRALNRQGQTGGRRPTGRGTAASATLPRHSPGDDNITVITFDTSGREAHSGTLVRQGLPRQTGSGEPEA